MKYYEIEELAPWCALNRIFGFSPKTGHSLIRHFEGAGQVFRADRKEIHEVLGHGSPFIDKIIGTSLTDIAGELKQLKDKGCRFIRFDDERYPPLLKDCQDPPIGIYIKGNSAEESILCTHPAVAVVGTRDITSYGTEWCTRIIASLSRCRIRPTIVSGLAIGTDITAHTAAMDYGLPTLAVMATGIEDIYPFRHGWAADRICNSPDSGLITDYPPGTVPKAINFLRRNRIIAGISRAVILIESKKKGGGMITCRLANSYNRDVYALPGRIDDTRSAGCNELFKDKIAEPVTDTDELADMLGLGSCTGDGVKDLKSYVLFKYKETETISFAEEIAKVADIISRNRDIRMEEICSLCEFSYRKVSQYVGIMECDGIIVTDIMRRCSINPKIM